MKYSKFLMLLLSLAALASCEKYDKDDPDGQAKYELHKKYMDVYYYWADDVRKKNDAVDPSSYKIGDYFKALLYSSDRWSWMTDRDSYVSSSTGVTVGGTWAVSLMQPVTDYKDYRVFVRYIYPGSPLEKYGVTRGAQLTSIGGVDISKGIQTQTQLDHYNRCIMESPQEFGFRLADGRQVNFKADWLTRFSTDYVLQTRVFKPGDYPGLTEKVGYLNFLSFNYNNVEALTAALRSLKASGVRRLILDLRYNGGGDARVSDSLVSFIAPLGSQNKVYVKRTHNRQLSKSDYEQVVGDENNCMGLEEVYFIMGAATASASEMVYNGMRPFYKDRIHHVGRVTYGKPNGMYVLMYPGDASDKKQYDKGNYANLKYVFYPICFFNVNSAGEMIPETGFEPEFKRGDDVYHDFGVHEGDIAACLHHIVTRKYPDEPSQSYLKASVGGSGIVVPSLIPDEIKNPNYGLCTSLLRE